MQPTSRDCGGNGTLVTVTTQQFISQIDKSRLTSATMSDAERDERTGDQWILSVIAYLHFNAGTPWRKLNRAGQRFHESRWYFLAAANLLNQLRYQAVEPCACSRCFVGRKPVARANFKAKAATA